MKTLRAAFEMVPLLAFVAAVACATPAVAAQPRGGDPIVSPDVAAKSDQRAQATSPAAPLSNPAGATARQAGGAANGVSPVATLSRSAAAPIAPVSLPISNEPARIGVPINATVGKSAVVRLPDPISRISLGNPQVADITLISAREIYVLGKALGSTNVILWSKSGGTTVIDVAVGLDTAALTAQLHAALPNEKDIRVEAAAGSLLLQGTVSSALAADAAVSLAEAYVRDLNRALVLPVAAGEARAETSTTINLGGTSAGAARVVGAVGSRVINLLKVREQQQVMLEVKVAEISKNLLDKLGVELGLLQTTAAGIKYALISKLFDPNAAGLAGIQWPNGGKLVVYGDRTDGLIKVLAEPNIVAISGQEGSFLAGGRVYLPVVQNSGFGAPVITLQEQEFGVGLRFTPTVLEGGRINLKVAPEVSEPLRSGLEVTTAGRTAVVLPAFSSRKASTTVQLRDGQTLAIAGLIKNNVTEAIKAFPILGEIPVLGVLFRSSEFQTDRTELVFIITPRLVKTLPEDYALPTDNFTPPSRTEFFLEGKLEGTQPVPAVGMPAPAPVPQQQTPGGFQIK